MHHRRVVAGPVRVGLRGQAPFVSRNSARLRLGRPARIELGTFSSAELGGLGVRELDLAEVDRSPSLGTIWVVQRQVATVEGVTIFAEVTRPCGLEEKIRLVVACDGGQCVAAG